MRPTYSNVAATLALAVSLGGGAAVAAGAVGQNSVGSAQIKPNSIRAADLAPNSVTASELAGGPIPGLAGLTGLNKPFPDPVEVPIGKKFVTLASGKMTFEAPGRLRATGTIEVTNTTGDPLGLCDNFVVDGIVIFDFDETIAPGETRTIPILTQPVAVGKGPVAYSIRVNASAPGLEVGGLAFATDEFRPIVIPPGRGSPAAP